jgi:hypothetical protein
VALSAGAVVAACQGKEGRPSSESAAGIFAAPAERTATAPPSTKTTEIAPAETGAKGCCGGAMAAVPGMRGMHGRPPMHGMMSAAMMDSMQAHMKKMSASMMSADQMVAMIPMHRQMVEGMLTQMTNEARSMNMTPSAAWTALSDSVRQDLARLPDLSKAELKPAMATDCARVGRLMQTYKKMMPAPAR